MASYNKEKLLRLISRKRQAHVALLDLGDRARAAHSDMSLLRSLIYEKADYLAERSGHVDRLMNLSYEAACKLNVDDIQGYDRQINETTRVIKKTGINAESYRKFIAARELSRRLSAEYDAARGDYDVRFGIVLRLIEWVKERGFRDPEREAL